MPEWPFHDAPRTAVFTVRRVVRERAPILLVSHDGDDGSWQFHTEGEAAAGDAMIVALEEILAIDPTVAELADLPLGWTATRAVRGDAWVRVSANPPPAGFICDLCGQTYEGPGLDIGFRRPEAFLRIPESERAKRCRANDDLVAVDGRSWFIRGVLHLPLTDRSDAAALGVWASVSEASFYRYRELFDDPGQAGEPPFRGSLATVIPGLPSTEGLPVEVRLTSAEDRPSIRVQTPDHLLGRLQAPGLPFREWMRILHHAIHAPRPTGAAGGRPTE